MTSNAIHWVTLMINLSQVSVKKILVSPSKIAYISSCRKNGMSVSIFTLAARRLRPTLELPAAEGVCTDGSSLGPLS